jgi:hypothetical protein
VRKNVHVARINIVSCFFFSIEAYLVNQRIDSNSKKYLANTCSDWVIEKSNLLDRLASVLKKKNQHPSCNKPRHCETN